MDNIVSSENITTLPNPDQSWISLMSAAGMTEKIIFLILFIASIYSWGIIIDKSLRIAAIKRRIKAFEEVFWSGRALEELYEKIKKNIDNPLSAIFVNAVEEFKKGKEVSKSGSDFLKVGHKERVMQAMYTARNRALEELEDRLGFLATVGSAATFIGLLGTVLGIMNSFRAIAISKNTSLVAVAPGIAEALLATALGLFVAIPAVVFYNYLTSGVDKISNKSEDFIGDLGTLLSRAIDENKI